MAKYISKLTMSVFVQDYDHNAPDIDHLKATHESFFNIIRISNPNLPVIFLSAPNLDENRPHYEQKRAVVFDTYAHALAKGDKNVYFVDGDRLFGGDNRDACTVDGGHPNDLGFYRMADALIGAFELIYQKENK